MSKISYSEFLEMILDPSIPESRVEDLLTIEPQRSGAFSPRFVSNSELVEISEAQQELEGIIDIGNSYYRAKRQRRFKDAIQNGDQRPVLVSEGDSWFQYPRYIDEVIDHLDSRYLIWSMGAAGDTAANMTGPNREYMRGLNRWENDIRGFLFSAGGNDVIGEDEAGKPVLEKLLKPYNAGQGPAWHIERTVFNATLASIRDAYTKMIRTIRSDARFVELPIIIHGYDYPFPYPFGDADSRKPPFGARNKWLGGPFEARGFPSDNTFGREVLIVRIDALYSMMNDLAAEEFGRIFVVNVRGSMPEVECWSDELHGTNEGFGTVAERFDSVIAPLVS